MRRALSLAEKGRGAVSPNPMVGAVIVKDSKVVGEGYHKKHGAAHAEVNAINAAGDHALGATMYVILEPCNHTGKTGPCTHKIFEAGISAVVVGMIDPNPLVNGKGIQYLRSKGIAVVENVLEKEARELNRAYIKYIQTGKPYIVLKLAQTLDGRIASSTGHSKWVTGENSRSVAHKLRAQHDAILVGIGTILMDDPHLTVRKFKGLSPKRIVLDSQLRIPLDANVLSDESPNKTIIVTTNTASKEKIARIVERGSIVLVLDADERGWVPQDILWRELGALGITSIMVEGGSSVHTECLKSRHADEIIIFFAPKILGTGVDAIGDLGIRNMNSALKLENLKIKRLQDDFMLSANLQKESGEF
ncbi:bifunctional diaminohydroxyphosphoribosylaminopyrimidine deaminase/5-amino-6-(5-phosphoribosylamino)uracil reductase RibD [candidate division KSB1 bacterium]|nr:bifunctional diaminohydroxyphosphoribosylaminopyrimidine deaminase/5-amino-6-(5-phosphoribosylamino)uracil reductase RibD [candidate division KSB1 bacterium]RQW01204.1 MAG: bifunctional diaminohydroxyphosphoribosylaminopyrimidine deaminase/5-amino-6-(5-phosphoribosylamino)uracil reductase RibD [candidate division KSB1 bacterium]